MNSELALKIMRKYGFSSVNDSPYLSLINNRIGVSFIFSDICFGTIERTCLFTDYKRFERFLNVYRVYIDRGKNEGVELRLDDYSALFPTVFFVKNRKRVLSNELLLGVVDKKLQTEIDVLKTVARNLLNYYVDVSSGQVEYINNVSLMKNMLLKKERILYDEINKIKKNVGIKRRAPVKEHVFRYDDSFLARYEDYLKKAKTKEHVVSLILNLWNLNKKLELSKDYYESKADIIELGEKIRLVDAKIDYVRSLKGKKGLFVNLKATLKQIDAHFVGRKVDSAYVDKELGKVIRKYSMYEKLSIYSLDDYLKEAYLYDNYEHLANKYSNEKNDYKSSGEIVAGLRKAYQLLGFNERRVLTLFNSKYRSIFDLILEIPDFNQWPNKKLVKYLEGIESVSRFKEECIDELCVRLSLDFNKEIKEKYFVDINFKSFKFFVQDMVKLLIIFKNINDRMILNGDMILYADLNSISSLRNKYVYYLDDGTNNVLGNAKTKNRIIGIFNVLSGTPVLYSPYMLDFGDLYDKSSRLIKEMRNNKIGIVVDVNDVIIMRDNKLSDVYYYKNVLDSFNGVSVVTDIKYIDKVRYCNFTIRKREE